MNVTFPSVPFLCAPLRSFARDFLRKSGTEVLGRRRQGGSGALQSLCRWFKRHRAKVREGTQRDLNISPSLATRAVDKFARLINPRPVSKGVHYKEVRDGSGSSGRRDGILGALRAQLERELSYGRTAQKHDAADFKQNLFAVEGARSSLHALLKLPSFIYAASRVEEPENLAKFASSSETWANEREAVDAAEQRMKTISKSDHRILTLTN